MSEGKECISEAPVAKKEQAKLKPVKDKGNVVIFTCTLWSVLLVWQ